MKFVTIKIPVTVEHQDPLEQHVTKTETAFLAIRMTMHDAATTEDVLARLQQKLDDKLSLIDLGDET